MSYLSVLFDHFDADHGSQWQPIIWSSIAKAKDRFNPVPDTHAWDGSACGELNLIRSDDRNSLQGWASMVFSDRVSGDRTGPRDRWRVEISSNGEVEITLLEWAPDRPFRLARVSFFEGDRGGQFMTGLLNESNGVSVVSMSFDRGLRPKLR